MGAESATLFHPFGYTLFVPIWVRTFCTHLGAHFSYPFGYIPCMPIARKRGLSVVLFLNFSSGDEQETSGLSRILQAVVRKGITKLLKSN